MQGDPESSDHGDQECSSSDEYEYVMDPNASEEEVAVYQHSGVSLTYLHGVFTRHQDLSE